MHQAQLYMDTFGVKCAVRKSVVTCSKIRHTPSTKHQPPLHTDFAMPAVSSMYPVSSTRRSRKYGEIRCPLSQVSRGGVGRMLEVLPNRRPVYFKLFTGMNQASASDFLLHCEKYCVLSHVRSLLEVLICVRRRCERCVWQCMKHCIAERFHSHHLSPTVTTKERLLFCHTSFITACISRMSRQPCKFEDANTEKSQSIM